jgi:hypothetical protein
LTPRGLSTSNSEFSSSPDESLSGLVGDLGCVAGFDRPELDDALAFEEELEEFLRDDVVTGAARCLVFEGVFVALGSVSVSEKSDSSYKAGLSFGRKSR